MSSKVNYSKIIIIALSLITFLSILYIVKNFKNDESDESNVTEKTIPKKFKPLVDFDIEIYPIGWSKNSNFAVIVNNYEPFVGSFYTLIIQNTINDKILEYIVFEEKYNESYESFDELWGKKELTIKRYLNEYMINYDLSTAPFERISTNGNLDFSISYRKKKENYYNDIHDYYSKQNMGFRISVSNGNGSKTITRKDLSSPFENIFYLGSLKSPFENRIVIMSGYTPVDYQGDPYEAIYFSGCSLDSRWYD